jgi:hypothetical protein
LDRGVLAVYEFAQEGERPKHTGQAAPWIHGGQRQDR